jgi:hypothetical protein
MRLRDIAMRLAALRRMNRLPRHHGLVVDSVLPPSRQLWDHELGYTAPFIPAPVARPPRMPAPIYPERSRHA